MIAAIRSGSARDLDAVMQVMTCAFDPAFGEAWSAPQCLGVLGMPGVWLLLAEQDAAPAGFALNRIVLDEAELLLVAVAPGFRRRGIACALIDRTVADARTRGASRLHLEVRAGNSAGLLYARHGFAEIGRRRGYYRGRDGQLFDAQTLMRDLQSGDATEIA